MRETSLLRQLALEEEVLIGAENINKTCNNALRYATQIRNLVSDSRNHGKERTFTFAIGHKPSLHASTESL